MKVTDKIINSEIVIAHFGYWPTFHDATINRVIFHTLPTYKYAITIFIKAFEMTNQINEEGYYLLDKECVIEIEFSGIQEIVYEDFNFQNVAFEILFTEEKNLIICQISPSTGLYAMIKAEEVIIMNLQKVDKGNKDKKTA